MIKAILASTALLFLSAHAGKAWVLTLEYKEGKVSLLSKEQTEAQLKKARYQPSESEFKARHTSEFGFIVRDSKGQVIKTHEGHLPGKVHADFAETEERHFDEHFTTVDTFQVIIPAQEGSTIEFLSREPESGVKNHQSGQGGAQDQVIPLPLRSVGSVEL